MISKSKMLALSTIEYIRAVNCPLFMNIYFVPMALKTHDLIFGWIEIHPYNNIEPTALDFFSK